MTAPQGDIVPEPQPQEANDQGVSNCHDPQGLGAFLAAAHRDQLALCASLEAIADSLPERIDRPACINAARALGPVITYAQTLEEEKIFPAITRRWPHLSGLSRTIERLKFEHLEDTCFSEEVFDALMAYGRGENVPTPEAFGYMLRGFFESLRRHIAFEQEVVMPLLRLDSAATRNAID